MKEEIKSFIDPEHIKRVIEIVTPLVPYAIEGIADALTTKVIEKVFEKKEQDDTSSAIV